MATELENPSGIPTSPSIIQKGDNEISQEDKMTVPNEGSGENLDKISEQNPDEDLTVSTKQDGEKNDADLKEGSIEEPQASRSEEGALVNKEGEETEGDKEESQINEDAKPAEEDQNEEEDVYIEEPPPDPTAPYDLSDSKEALKEPFELRPDQLAEVEQLWELYQNYTPAYTDIHGYITEKELIYMLKGLLLMTYTPEQLQELISYCARPPNAEGHITFEQFVKMVTIRQRDFEIEDELRSSLQVFDPGRTGTIDREYFKEVLAKQGHKMPQKQLDNLIKEVDMSNDGTIGIEDVVGTMCIDLNKEDLMMLRNSVYPPDRPPAEENF